METLKLLMFLIFLPAAMPLEDHTINLTVDYFNHRGVKIVCLLVCPEDNQWVYKFTRVSAQSYVAVSAAFISSKHYDRKGILSCMNHTFWNAGVFVDAQCPSFGDVMYLASEENLFDSSHFWIIIDNNNATEDQTNYPENNSTLPDFDKTVRETNIPSETFNILSNLNFSVDANIVLATESINDNSYDLYDIYNFGKVLGGRINVVPMGKWSKDTGLQIWLTGYKYYQRWDFKQLNMRMIVVSARPALFQPEMVTSRKSGSDINLITKVPAIILNIVAEKHNFRFMYAVTDRWIGTFNSNSSRVAANSLYFHEQDVTPLLRITPDIFAKVDFVHPSLVTLETKYYYRIPDYGVGKLENKFLTPLSIGCWLCVIGISALCGFVLVLAALLERRPSSAQYAVFTVVAAVCQQFFESNEEKEVRRVSTARRLTVLVTGISCLLLYNYYTSSVVSWLLSGPPPSINSLEELLNSPLELIFEDIGYCKSWLQTPTYYFNKRNAKIEDELRAKKVFNKKKDAPLLLTLDQGIDMVKAGGFAFHTQVTNANERISQIFNKMELCELGSLQSMEKTELYSGIPKRSPYKEFLVWSLARLNERGHVSCIQRQYASPDISCDGNVPRALALGGAAPAFIMLASGYILATGLLLGEMALANYRLHKVAAVPFVKY